MTSLDTRTVPVDTASRERLAATGLDYRAVDSADRRGLALAARAIARGFLEAEPSGAAVAAECGSLARRRLLGVYDASCPQPDTPVATIGSWVAPVTVPGGELDMWAVSEVTVAATHRRRGIARAMLEGELRDAAGAGVALAGLTASEATIYGRYGFGPATWRNTWTVDTRRAGWAAAEPAGRLQHLDGEALADALGRLHERTRRSRVGDIPGWPLRWRRLAGVVPGEPHGASVRGVRYVDESGEARGAMAYRVITSEADWSRSTLDVRHLVAETAEARAALWGFALRHDLVGTVTAGTRPVDDALPWLIADQRAAVPRTRDHGWLRVLDVPRALEARAYRAPLSAVLHVEDRLGLAAGSWRIDVAPDGSARVTAADGGAGGDPAADDGVRGDRAGGERADDPDAVVSLRMGVAELSSLYLGGVSADALAEAGRVRGGATAVARFDAAFGIGRAPHLSIEY